MINFLINNSGLNRKTLFHEINKIKSLFADFGGRPTETQYENVSAFGNKLTKKLNDNFFKIISWYDNECGYSSKLISLAQLINNI